MSQRSNFLLWSVVAALGVAAACLRLHGISDKSLWTDEGVSVAFTRLPWYDLGRILWRREGNMALYYLLLRGWSHMGDSEAIYRGFSALWSVATLPVLYMLGRRLFSPFVGVAAALLWTVNAYSIRYAQEARSYSLVTFLVTIATLFLLNAVQSTESKARSAWTCYIAASTLAIYAHFFAVLVVFAHLTVLWRTPSKGGIIRAAKLIALWTIPIWLFIATTGAGPIAWIPRPTPRLLWTILSSQAGNGGMPLAFLYAAGFVSAAAAWMRTRDSCNFQLLLSWWILPVAIAYIVSFVRPVFLPRYFIICVPAMVLIIAAGICSLKPRVLSLIFLGLTCWFAIVGVNSYYKQDFDLMREDFRSAANHVVNHAESGDSIVLHRAQSRFAYAYYADRAFAAAKPAVLYPGTEKPVWGDFMAKVTPTTLAAVQKHNGRIWILITQPACSTNDDGVASELKASAAAQHRLSDVRQFDNLCLYLYQ